MKKLAIIILAALALFSCGNTTGSDDTTYYTVTFDSDGGGAFAKQSVAAGGKATFPGEPAKDDYVFLYWALDGENEAYDFNTPVNSNITLVAAWLEEGEAEYWQVSWELNGGTWPASYTPVSQVVQGGTLAEPAAPVKADSTFDGWYKEAALTNKVTFPFDASGVTADFTLYAKWKANGQTPVNNNITVASGKYHYFSLKADGTLLAFGRNDSGQLGTGNRTDLGTLTQVTSNVAAVYAGGETSFIVKKDGTVLGCGSYSGELDLGNTTAQSSFTNNVKAMAVGSYHSLLLKNDGSVWATGWNVYGQLGTGDEEEKSVFTATNLTSNVISISAGSEHSLALKDDGTVWGTGYSNGALGEASPISLSFVNIFSGAKAIAAGGYFSLILKSDGTVYASGDNYYGELGIGNIALGDSLWQFTQAIDDTGAPLTDVTAIAAGYQHSLALKSDGTLWAAGRNEEGRLGTGDNVDRSKFTQVAAGVKSMSAGRFHTVIVKNDGTIVTFGLVNPWNALNGTGTIAIRVNDTTYYQYIKSWHLYNYSTEILWGGDIATGLGEYISVKPGTYNMSFTTSNSGTRNFQGLTVGDNQTVTITYEYVSGYYQWTVK